MPELAKKVSNLKQGGVIPFTLFDLDGISITLDLPNIFKLKLGEEDDCSAVPMLTNNSPYTVMSATFSITLDESVFNPGKEEIATVQWLNSDSLAQVSSMRFTCGQALVGQKIQCVPETKGYNEIQFKATMNSGEGKELLSKSLTLESILLGAVASEAVPDAGPVINVSASNN
ncbi:hypothetical protein [Pseudomonas chlororaphis]|uniref:hypothetical protein n=1 Tax=Pseudomonas chlororaphis TaxID=587753 RepID=UPI003C21D761